MADYNRATIARAAAILTTGEVAAAAVQLQNTHGAEVSVAIDFTLGSLTNCTFRFYGSVDGTNWDRLFVGGTASNVVLTASDDIAVLLSAPGYKFFRASAQGSGTTTSSSATITYRWLRRGSQI